MAFKSGLIFTTVALTALSGAPAAFAQDTTVWLAVHEGSANATAEQLSQNAMAPNFQESLDIRFSNATSHCGGVAQTASNEIAFTFGYDADPQDRRRFDLPEGWLVASVTIPADLTGAYSFQGLELRGDLVRYNNGSPTGSGGSFPARSVADPAQTAAGFIAQESETFLGWYQVGLDASGQAHLASMPGPRDAELRLPVRPLTRLSQNCS
ncbi:hypothetical protein [Oceanicaulis sp.]|uniref:hypothetical protein n=1 Tax=Oceanicaulis sp. TaxID=1924941 RepID=UPI003BAD850F